MSQSKMVLLILGMAVLLVSGQAIASSDVVTIRLAGSQEAQWEPVYRTSIEAFEASHPNIKVEYEAISGTFEDLIVDIIAGTGPDVFVFNSFDAGRFYELGLTMPLNTLIERDDYDLGDFFPPMLTPFTGPQGEIIALPYDASTVVMFHNKTLLEEAGAEAPGPDFTWDDLLDTARKTSRRDSNGNPTVIGVDGSFWRAPWTLPSILKQNGGSFLSEDHQTLLLNSTESVEAIQWWADLSLVYDVAPKPGGPIAGGGGFVNGNIAMLIGGTWNPIFWTPQIGESFEWDASFVPARKERATALAGGGFAINAESTHPDEAWAFLKFWLGSDENSFITTSAREIHLGVPARRSALPTFEESYRAFTAGSGSMQNYGAIAASMAFAEHVPTVGYWNELSQIIAEGLAPVWTGEVSISSQVTSIVSQANAMIREHQER